MMTAATPRTMRRCGPPGRRAAEAEVTFLRSVNALAEPVIRAGFLFPTPCLPGPILVETRGRKSGARRTVPLLAVLLGELVIVSTVRGERSHWPKNLAAHPGVRFWLAGHERAATAFVFAPGAAPSLESLPPAVRPLAGVLTAAAATTGIIYAVLAPRPPAAINPRTVAQAPSG
jgi:deazaflavin-dependent oxidoreductase (nitroreductase family)